MSCHSVALVLTTDLFSALRGMLGVQVEEELGGVSLRPYYTESQTVGPVLCVCVCVCVWVLGGDQKAGEMGRKRVEERNNGTYEWTGSGDRVTSVTQKTRKGTKCKHVDSTAKAHSCLTDLSIKKRADSLCSSHKIYGNTRLSLFKGTDYSVSNYRATSVC